MIVIAPGLPPSRFILRLVQKDCVRHTHVSTSKPTWNLDLPTQDGRFLRDESNLIISAQLIGPIRKARLVIGDCLSPP